MKNIISILLYILLAPFSISASTLVEQADSAYSNDNYKEAVKLYNEVINTEGTSSNLYYNLGNSYYRLGQLGKAIICYERALILDPTNGDAKANLQFVNSKITDKPIDSGTFISNTLGKVLNLMHPNTWAMMTLIIFFVLLIGVALYIFSSSILVRKIGFFGGLISLLIFIIMLIFSFMAANKATTHTNAVITVPSSILSTSPRQPKDRTEEAVLLHEGTKVEIVDSVTSRKDSITDKWYEVKIDHTNRAWINSSAVEKI